MLTQAEKPGLRDYITGLLAAAGVVLLCCEAPTLAGQALAALGGFALWGLAAVVWCLSTKQKAPSEPVSEDARIL